MRVIQILTCQFRSYSLTIVYCVQAPSAPDLEKQKMSRLTGAHTTLLAVVTALLLVQCMEQVAAVPANANTMDVALLQRAMRQGNECALNAGIRDMCQRCAKVTRSAVAYPLCCQNQENPRRWCLKFLEFGLT